MAKNEAEERAKLIWGDQVEKVHPREDGTAEVELRRLPGDTVRREAFPLGDRHRYYFHDLDHNGHAACHEECKQFEGTLGRDEYTVEVIVRHTQRNVKGAAVETNVHKAFVLVHLDGASTATAFAQDIAKAYGWKEEPKA